MDAGTFAKLSELENEIEDLENQVKKLQRQVDINETSLRQMAADLIAMKKKVK